MIHIVGKWHKYLQIRHYLIEKSIVDVADMWIRHEGKHDVTPKGRCWEYVNPRVEITTDLKEIDIEVVNVQPRGDYMVALLHEADKEIPMPIGNYVLLTIL
jgi:hypothetical protein